MKKKTLSIFMVLIFAMTLFFGNALNVFADESSDFDNIYYDGLPEKDSDGYYNYVVACYEYFNSETGGYYFHYRELKSNLPLVAFKYSNYTDKFDKFGFANKYDSATGGAVFKFVNGVSNGVSYVTSITGYDTLVSDTGEVTTNTSININTNFWFVNNTVGYAGSFTTNIPLFNDEEAACNYLDTYIDSGAINKKPVVNNSFYLKNVGYSVRAEDSSENADETYIKFTWDTDNLQEGDLLEVKTKNHLTKIGGDQIIGFYDYVTSSSGVDCYSGVYEMSQTDAVKAWFSSLENAPVVFKDYDTDIYFLRPVRGNQYGLWTKIVMGRTTPTSSPYIKDIEYGELDDNGDWSVSDDVTTAEGGNHGIDQNGNVIASGPVNSDGTTVDINSIGDLMKYLISQLGTLIGYFGQLPQLINQVIGWLPSPIIVLICGFIAVVIILRIFGR